MKILQINITNNMGSTGKIMHDLNDVLTIEGMQGYMLCAYQPNKIADKNVCCMYPKNAWLSIRTHILESRISGRMGYSKKKETKKAIQWINTIKPDIIHMHNIHGNWICIPMLLEYIKAQDIPVVWTLHDCWSFTGRCSHFEQYGCLKWSSGCERCKNFKVYPITYFFDYSKSMWNDKKQWFTGLKDAILVTPSVWLADYVRRSFMKSYPVQTIHNGIDLSQFHAVQKRSDYLKEFGEIKILLGVAACWTEHKGLQDFFKLNDLLDKERYRIVLVGLNHRQMQMIPKDILGIERTNNIEELVELYSSADVFINPTYQDNYPTVNMEALACGTPVITYRTGGSVESVPENVGYIVDQGDIIGLREAIEKVCENSPFKAEKCIEYAKEHFDKNKCYLKYIEIYKTIAG